mgnify:CR=1 FL=1
MSPHEPAAATERKQRISGVFDRAAVTYDQLGPHYFSYFGRRLVDLMLLPAGASVLDVATGRGATLFPAAAKVGIHGRVVGTDFAATMVAETANELVLRNVTNVEVRQMDAEHLEFPHESFDYLLCGFALFFFPQLERAMAEFRRVLQILLNLVGNAIRYAPEATRISIALSRVGGEARITVADEGPGLSPEQAARVFDKFERLGRSGDGGSGLGLYISRRLARAMGGELSVESAPAEGARFTLAVPAG